VSVAAGARAVPFRGWAVGNCDAEHPTLLATTNGVDWFRQGLGSVPRLTLHSVAVSPSGAKVWIAGTTNSGFAVLFHSPDAGATWTRQGDPAILPDQEIYKIRAADEKVVWAVGQGGTVLRTRDAGATWESRPIPGFTGHLQAVAALDDQTAWVGGAGEGQAAALFRTTDGGATWTNQCRGGLTNLEHVLGLHAVDTGTVWALGGPLGIVATTNGGDTWVRVYGGGTLRDGNEIHVSPDGRVWAATDSAVFWSFDQGTTWTSASVAEFCMGIASPDGTNVWAVSDHWSGGIIYRSSDSGRTWDVQVTLPGAGCSDVAFVPHRPPPRSDDYDGDGRSDLAVWNPSSGQWYIASLSNSVPAPGAERRRGAVLAWAEPWGWPDAILAPGDYDGDGRTDLAAFDPATGLWYVRSLARGILAWALPWLGVGMIPVPGDYDADGAHDLAVYQPADGRWYAWSLAQERVLVWGVGLGGPGLIPVPGDYDADRASDLAVYDPSAGFWYGLKAWRGPLPGSEQVLFWALPFGGSGLAPVPGDYDGDGAADLAVYSGGIWYAASLDGRSLACVAFGLPGMIPLAGDYDADGADDFVLYDPARGLWYAYSVRRAAVVLWAEPWGGPAFRPVSCQPPPPRRL
jgi:photosystem II stability/assembly factor-like uncharacterized protein